MADLENLLLEAAGRTGSGRKQLSRPQLKRRQEGSYSDNGSYPHDDSDSPVFTSQKPSGSQVPLKKRLESNDRDEDWSSDSGDDDNGSHSGETDSMSSIGSDLYIDDADRAKLADMTELQREMILSERADKKNDRQLKEKVRGTSSTVEKITTRSRNDSPPLLPARRRSSVNRSNRTQKDALNELRAKRMRQRDMEGHRRLRDEFSVGGDRDSSPGRSKDLDVRSFSDSSRSGSRSRSVGDSKDEVSVDGLDLGGSDDDVNSSVLTYDHIKDITIHRTKLAKWFMEPFFEELIVGCFVRVGIGMNRSGQSVYRLCMVRNVDASESDRPYKFEGRTTHKYLNIVWGSDSTAARWQMDRISDSPPLLKEFNEWKREIERNGGRMPSPQDAIEKKDAIERTNTFVYSAATVKQMLQEKKSASSKPFNIAAEKDRLRREMEVALSRRDDEEVERIQARLQELEAARQAKENDYKAVRLAEMNRRNRAENFRNASELKRVNTSLKAGEAGYDPFSRRWTRSRNYYVSKPEGGGDATETISNGEGTAVSIPSSGNGSGAVSSEAGLAATTAALEAAADAGKLVDTAAPVDKGTELNSLHDFDLPISLAGLQMYGGPQGFHLGFMARKQRIEATTGFGIPENDGRRHPLTLTVSDYKRRRGLL